MTVADKTRVVIAEDEAIIRLDLKELLEEEGYEVVGETGRGDEAIELVRQTRPDIAILDIKMPGMDGLSAARHISSERLAAVLVLTAFSQRDLIPAIEMALGRHAELASLERDVGDLAERLEARKLTDRAKGILQDQHGLSEQESWRFLQTQAMSQRVKMEEVARQVIDGELTP